MGRRNDARTEAEDMAIYEMHQNEGKSYGEIREALGMTRSAVCGVIFRVKQRLKRAGIAVTMRAPAVKREPHPKTIFSPAKTQALPKLRKGEVEAPIGPPDSFVLDGCPFLYGDIRTPGWRQCGHEVVRGSYCAGHAELCYQPPAARVR